jgi:type VI protein secretion system component Hcp
MSETIKEKKEEKITVEATKSDARKSFEEKVVMSKKEEDKDKAPVTYISLQDETERTLFEMDLVFIRQKGENEKFLEITFTEATEVNGQSTILRHVKEVRTKEEFEKLKDYFINLSWD